MRAPAPEAPADRWPAPPAFDEYVRARHAELLRFAHVLCGDPHLAADLVQDALVGAGLAWRRVRRTDDPEGYVRRAIVNRYLSRWRRLRRERLVASVPDRSYTDREPVDGELWRLLGTLPRQQRAVLVLRFYADLSEVQVAEVLGCTTGTVKSTGHRALARLRAALAERGDQS
jgi:RNA polymerase sigma-70 factor (sigma-E family)